MLADAKRLKDTLPSVEAFLLDHAELCPEGTLVGDLRELLLSKTSQLNEAIGDYATKDLQIARAHV